jgi:hypothetical protein
MTPVPQTLDERIAAAESAGDWPTANALNTEKLAELAGKDAAANARRFADAPAASSADPVAGPSLDAQIADASAQRDWSRLDDLNAQKLAGLIAKANAEAVAASAVGEQMEADRSFRLHTELDPSNPDHAAALAEIDRAKTAAQLIDVYERQREKDRRRALGDTAY